MSPPSVAFFGATGGCALACLTHALQAGLSVVALVRTPAKLTKLLHSQGVDEAIIESQLKIIPGNAHDVVAVKQTLLGGENKLVDLIVSGLGGAPSVTFSWRAPFQLFTLDDVNVCEKATVTLMEALQEIYASEATQPTQRPLVVYITTTGITRGPEDVPFWMRFFYHHMLAIPHADKKKMDDLIRNNVDGTDGREKLFRNAVGIRPTLLTGTTDIKDAAGLDTVRAGTEPSPAVGYTIKRADVGEWIFRNVLENQEKRDQWQGQMVSLTS